jgi:acetyl-CoA acetyltransferase
MGWITGVGATRYGRHEGSDTLHLMRRAADRALADADLARPAVDGLLCGYSTTMPHLMLANVFAEHYGLAPRYAHAMSAGGATGFMMTMLAHHLVDAGVAEHVLVVAGENRLTGTSRDSAVQTLAQVGHPDYEVPLGATIPAYYALVAARYLHERRLTIDDLAPLAVLMRRHGAMHPGAQFRTPITLEDVRSSKPIAAPLRILDCCSTADGGAAIVVSRAPRAAHSVRVAGAAQAHGHQHVSAAASLTRFPAGDCARRALAQAGLTVRDIEYAGIYDSFTVTLAILLEELGLCGPGEAGATAAAGGFDRDGRVPLNTHGGLLSYGHCGVGGALAHLVEAALQLSGRAGDRQAGRRGTALLHGDGGVLSSHCSLVLETRT